MQCCDNQCITVTDIITALRDVLSDKRYIKSCVMLCYRALLCYFSITSVSLLTSPADIYALNLQVYKHYKDCKLCRSI